MLGNIENAVEAVYKPRTGNLVKCPHCGESYYMKNYSMCTAMAWTPIYKNGVLQNSDPNITTTFCTCMNCGKNFEYER